MNREVGQNWPEISRHVWETRYRWQQEADVQATWSRVARAAASVETVDAAKWAVRFEDLLTRFRFLPGGRILAGAGTDRRVTLFNCFVMGVVTDSIEGIFESLKQGALTMQAGGGVGYDFSTLRPQGMRAPTTGSVASGPVSFMKIWDAMCATLLSTGSRRGAMMATLRCDHPDIESFVDAKREPGVLRHFNLSVQVTDAFMSAVRADEDWPLVFPVTGSGAGSMAAASVLMRRWTGSDRPVRCEVVRIVKARALWDRMVRAAYDTAEPGVLFVDQINRENNLHDRENLTATNPCGEIPLPPYGACNLGSLNLATFVIEPFEAGARLDFAGLEAAARDSVRFLDDIIDLSGFPIEQQAVSARATRRIGLGVTGLADALAMLGQRYDGWTARGVAEEIIRRICVAAYAASSDLALERGVFPHFDREAYLDSRFVARLPQEIRERIARQGMRNSHLVAIAPAGTISLLAGNVSSGIEPIFSMQGERRVLGADGRYHTHAVDDFAWRLWRTHHAGEVQPDALVAATAVDARSHLDMQSALQPWVDGAISKTINVPAELPFEDFAGLYALAHSKGLKGCTVFRPNPVRGAILAATPGTAEAGCCNLDREAD